MLAQNARRARQQVTAEDQGMGPTARPWGDCMLARLASYAESEAARVAMTKERRDRAYGRAGQLP
jgi:hypothetical protein